MISLGPVVQAHLPQQTRFFFGLNYSAGESEAADYCTAFYPSQSFIQNILLARPTPTLWPMNTTSPPHIAFIGGGNMASAIIGGLIRQGMTADQFTVVEPFGETAAKLKTAFGISALPAAEPALAQADLVVWAVKPQVFAEAAAPVSPHTGAALHLSVAAGIRTDSIRRWLGNERVVRSMPNTPALVGQGITGLFPCPAVSVNDRRLVEQVICTTGQYVWVENEAQLDAVTALSGSGPAYVFYFLEAMTEAGTGMGLTTEQSRQLAVATFSGAAALAGASSEPLEVLRQRVTSKGGTTHAAITAMEMAQIKPAFVQAMQAAEQRARELGDEFGKA
ncbi:MAG: Pyrroline-5-carboxylate reductase [Pseudomonadota bacterium]|jgi:pyrroline-5-carboxylate reductase